jgi:GNAT superfamily N-acetyltransferase
LLLDSNVVIAVEPYAGSLEPSTSTAATLVRLASEQGHLVCVAPATRDDLLEGSDARRRGQRIAELGKFHLLEEAPLEQRFLALAGDSPSGSNDHRDLRVLAALYVGAATHLVTDDSRLRRRATRAGLGESTLSLSEAVDLLTGFAPNRSSPPPRVMTPKTYTLNSDDPIFESLRHDYDGFDEWFARVRADQDTRSCYLVKEDDYYAALALLKEEPDCEYDLQQPVTKITTFKVRPESAGTKYGELLLKAILSDAQRDHVATLFVEVLPRHTHLIDFLADFGFADTGFRSGRGELVLRKTLLAAGAEPEDIDDLTYHITYGPPALLGRQEMYVVPIQPRWHDQLFPEQAPDRGAEQLALFEVDYPPLTHPWGNALRKAYICQSSTTTMRAGDILLLYRSTDTRAVTALLIVEAALRSTSPDEITRFVGRRTVYTPTDIAELCRSVRGALAIRFRQDRFVVPPWSLAELQLAHVLNSWPQSITRLDEEGKQWVRRMLVE